MTQLNLYFNEITGKIKPMNAVNNGPVKGPRMFPKSGNFDAFAEANIPYVRNHDAAFCASYGGEHTVDINAVFPNFDADPYDPASYDFICTDHYLETIMEAGSKVFYRLGNKIDHRIKKYDSLVPKDFQKWAVICEHIIAHYNEGWANGFHYGIEYWEIWNEPENQPECWTGTLEEFYEFFAVAAKHLKSKYPKLKIGGPAFASGGPTKQAPPFLTYMKENGVPLDFFSWHSYKFDPEEIRRRIRIARENLNTYGYTETESILNEWAYILNWGERMTESIRVMLTEKGASYVSAVMAVGQNEALDMLMYYDARPGATLNCLFNFYTKEKMKGYYPFYFFGKLLKLENQIKIEGEESGIYTVAAKNGSESAVMLTYFSDDENAENKNLSLSFEDGAPKYRVFLTDKNHDGEEVGLLHLEDQKGTLSISPNSIVFLQSI